MVGPDSGFDGSAIFNYASLVFLCVGIEVGAGTSTASSAVPSSIVSVAGHRRIAVKLHGTRRLVYWGHSSWYKTQA